MAAGGGATGGSSARAAARGGDCGHHPAALMAARSSPAWRSEIGQRWKSCWATCGPAATWMVKGSSSWLPRTACWVIFWSPAPNRPGHVEQPQNGEAAQRLSERPLEPGSEPEAKPSTAHDTWRRAPRMARYMRQVLCRKLSNADPAVMLRPLAGSASHLALLELLAADADERPEARKAVEFLLRSLPDGLLAHVLKLDAIGVDDLAGYPSAAPALGGRLRRLLDGLHDQTTEFSGQLDLLLAGQDLLPDPADRQRVLAWSQCRQAIMDLGRLQSQRGGWRRRRPLTQIDAACQRMVEAAQAAMPPEVEADDPPGAGNERRLQAIGQRLLGEPLLPPTQWHHTASGKKSPGTSNAAFGRRCRWLCYDPKHRPSGSGGSRLPPRDRHWWCSWRFSWPYL